MWSDGLGLQNRSMAELRINSLFRSIGLEQALPFSVLPAGKAPSDPLRALTSGAPYGLHPLRAQYAAIVVAGPGLDRAEEVVPMLRMTDRMVVVAVRGDKARDLENATIPISTRRSREARRRDRRRSETMDHMTTTASSCVT